MSLKAGKDEVKKQRLSDELIFKKESRSIEEVSLGQMSLSSHSRFKIDLLVPAITLGT